MSKTIYTPNQMNDGHIAQHTADKPCIPKCITGDVICEQCWHDECDQYRKPGGISAKFINFVDY